MPMTSCAALLATAFFVAPGGNDHNSGSFTAPFATLAKAQSAMNAASAKIKTTYLRAGLYTPAATITLGPADSGETWQQYPCEALNSAVVDGGGKVAMFLLNGAANVRFDGFAVRNVTYGIDIHGGQSNPNATDGTNVDVPPAPGTIVANMEAYNVGSCFTGNGNMPWTKIRDNYCHDTTGMGISFSNSGRDTDDISFMAITGNIVLNSCQTVSDCGAIYVQDISSRDMGVTIKNNYVVNYLGASNNTTHGIYLDQAMSNVEVRNNIVRAMARGDGLVSGFLISSGQANRIENNIFDQGCSAAVSIGQIISYPSGFISSMTGNIITRNLMLFHFTGSQNTTGYASGASYQMAGSVYNPWNVIVTGNDYFNSAGGAAVTTGNGVADAAPLAVDPATADATYQVPRGNSLLSAPFNFIDILPVWGPPGKWPSGSYPWMPALCG
jgi:hypothetical protein